MGRKKLKVEETTIEGKKKVTPTKEKKVKVKKKDDDDEDIIPSFDAIKNSLIKKAKASETILQRCKSQIKKGYWNLSYIYKRRILY